MVNPFVKDLTITLRTSDDDEIAIFNYYKNPRLALQKVSIDWGRDSIFSDPKKRQARVRVPVAGQVPADPADLLYTLLRIKLGTRTLFDGTVDAVDQSIYRTVEGEVDVLSITASENHSFIECLAGDFPIRRDASTPRRFFAKWHDWGPLPARWNTSAVNSEIEVLVDSENEGFDAPLFDSWGFFAAPWPNAHPIWEPGFIGVGPSVWSANELKRQPVTHVHAGTASLDRVSTRLEDVPMAINFLKRKTFGTEYVVPTRKKLTGGTFVPGGVLVDFFRREVESRFPLVGYPSRADYESAFKLIQNQQSSPLNITFTHDGTREFPTKLFHTWENKDQLVSIDGTDDGLKKTLVGRLIDKWLLVPIGGRITFDTERITHEMQLAYGVPKSENPR